MNIPLEVSELRTILEQNDYRLPSNDIQKLISSHKTLMKNSEQRVGSVYYKEIKLLSSFNRIVIGGHGPYIEFSKHHIIEEIEITKDQEWRLDSRYNPKYIWMNFVMFPKIKVYLQVNKVSYANYKPDFYYIDFWS